MLGLNTLRSAIVHLVCLDVFLNNNCILMIYVALASSSTLSPATDCAMSCSGDRWQVCGGPDRLTGMSYRPQPEGIRLTVMQSLNTIKGTCIF